MALKAWGNTERDGKGDGRKKEEKKNLRKSEINLNKNTITKYKNMNRSKERG